MVVCDRNPVTHRVGGAEDFCVTSSKETRGRMEDFTKLIAFQRILETYVFATTTKTPATAWDLSKLVTCKKFPGTDVLQRKGLRQPGRPHQAHKMSENPRSIVLVEKQTSAAAGRPRQANI